MFLTPSERIQRLPYIKFLRDSVPSFHHDILDALIQAEPAALDRCLNNDRAPHVLGARHITNTTITAGVVSTPASRAAMTMTPDAAATVSGSIAKADACTTTLPISTITAVTSVNRLSTDIVMSPPSARSLHTILERYPGTRNERWSDETKQAVEAEIRSLLSSSVNIIAKERKVAKLKAHSIHPEFRAILNALHIQLNTDVRAYIKLTLDNSRERRATYFGSPTPRSHSGEMGASTTTTSSLVSTPAHNTLAGYTIGARATLWSTTTAVTQSNGSAYPSSARPNLEPRTRHLQV